MAKMLKCPLKRSQHGDFAPHLRKVREIPFPDVLTRLLLRIGQERSASVADFPLDYLSLASTVAMALPLFSDEVLGSRMAGCRAASGSPAACSRAALAWPLACSHCRSGCHQEYHWCPRLSW